MSTLPIFGEPVAAEDVPQIIGEQQRVESIMADGRWHTIPELQRLLKQKFGQLYGEASIGARIRAMRHRGWILEKQRTRKGSQLYQYRAERLKPLPVMAPHANYAGQYAPGEVSL